MSVLETIRERKNSNIENTLLMMDMVPFSDTEAKRSLLSTAGNYLHDGRVIEKWIDLIAQETDTQLKADMLQRLSIQEIPDKTRFIALLASSLQQDEARDVILPLLGRFSIHDAVARQTLISFYQQQQNAEVSGLILSWLLIPVIASANDIIFYKSILANVGETDKLLIVNRLLLQDQFEDVSMFLSPDEPLAIKEMVLRFCFDRSMVPQEALIKLAREDKHPHIRIWAIQLLAVHGIKTPEQVQLILEVFSKDSDNAVKQAALKVFSYSVAMTPDIIQYLHNELATQPNIDISLQLLYLLTPYVDQYEALVDSLFALLDKGIKTTLAVRIYEILGKLVPYRLPLFGKFLLAYEKEQHEDCKAAILAAITNAVTFGNELNMFYLKALEAPSFVIKEWGMQGILQVPLTKENIPVVTAAAPVLLHTSLNRELRRLLAKKISCIPQLPAETIQVFNRLADHDSDPRIKEICDAIQEQAVSQGDASVDWEQWLHKANVEHDLTGIFPHIWMYYDRNPAMAAEILWSAINPANSGTLYQQGVEDITVLRFLTIHQGGNDELSRYALNKLLTADLGYESRFIHYLLVLKSNPGFEELKEGLWLLQEKRSRYINQILLEQILQLVFGEQLYDVFIQRINKQNSAAGLIPYLLYLGVNNTWEPAPALLEMIVQKGYDDNDFISAVKETARKCGVDPEELMRKNAAPSNDGPGFAD
jgi:hypothetical protein